MTLTNQYYIDHKNMVHAHYYSVQNNFIFWMKSKNLNMVKVMTLLHTFLKYETEVPSWKKHKIKGVWEVAAEKNIRLRQGSNWMEKMT